jgi:hypothetical protein
VEVKTGNEPKIPQIIPLSCHTCGAMDVALYELSNVSKFARERLFCMRCAEAKVRHYEHVAEINAGMGVSDENEVVKLKAENAELRERLTVLEKAEEQPEDIAKQRWMVYSGVAGIEVRQKRDGHEPSLATVRYGTLDAKAKLVATDAQIRLMAAAPELLEALESYGDHSAGLAEFCKRKNAAIRKARGGE